MPCSKKPGAEGLEFSFNNRGVDQPYKVVGTWLVDQWRKVGFKPQAACATIAAVLRNLAQEKRF
ncbi:MAG: hypothetical protein Ct9H300mP13_7880 [Gammaproteobacteria bacterium]|nr:MAG: hypothetical protein Ct9H300mP13_7880 [Gammaproteobacteria bacterium]